MGHPAELGREDGGDVGRSYVMYGSRKLDLSRSLAGGDGLDTIEVAGTGVFCTVQRVCEYSIVTCKSVHVSWLQTSGLPRSQA